MIKFLLHIQWTSFLVWSIDRLTVCNVDRINPWDAIAFPIIPRRSFSQATVGLCSSVRVVNNSCCGLDFFLFSKIRASSYFYNYTIKFNHVGNNLTSVELSLYKRINELINPHNARIFFIEVTSHHAIVWKCLG